MRSNCILSSACVFGLFLLPSSAGAQTGALTQLPGTDACISEDGTGGACADGVGLAGPIGVAVSRDGRNVYAASAADSAVAVFARDRRSGALTQLRGTDACVREERINTGGDCADGVGLGTAIDVAVSLDGRNLYVASFGPGGGELSSGNAVAVFARDRRSGALTQLPGTDACVSEDGSGGDCADGVGLELAMDVTVSPDGRNVYVASRGFFNSAVAVFARDRRSGALIQLPGTDACVSDDGAGADCADGVALDTPASVAVSPDGRNVYVASEFSNAVAVFARDRRTGALTQLSGTDACVSEEGSGGDCADGIALAFTRSVEVSPDGRNVYVGSSAFGSNAVAVFARDRRSGALTQLPGTDACVSEDGTGGACADGVALLSPERVTVSLDGRNVYVVSRVSNALAVFARDRRTGALTQLPGTDACVSEDGTGGACADGLALLSPEGVTVSLDGRNVYVGSAGSSAVAAFARGRDRSSLASR